MTIIIFILEILHAIRISIEILRGFTKFNYLGNNSFIGNLKNINHLINPFRTAKAATNGNHRLCLKLKPQVKCH